MSAYPKVKDVSLIGEYPALVKSGGGYVWDEVLEYRVWCHPQDGALDKNGNGEDYYFVFGTYEEALEFSQTNLGSKEPLALILQEEFIDEPEPGDYRHLKQQRLTEWPVEFLTRPRRTARTIPDFFSPNAPANRLDILRGLV
jgi:hypothetical protein